MAFTRGQEIDQIRILFDYKFIRERSLFLYINVLSLFLI